MNYIGEYCAYRKSAVEEAGGFGNFRNISKYYDLISRIADNMKSGSILHVSKILHHRREEFPFGELGDKGLIEENKRVLKDYLYRNDIKGEVEMGFFANTYRVRRDISGKEKVSIIIPFRDQKKYLKKCVSSILRKTDYENYEIILVDNQSQEIETKSYLKEIKNNSRIRILEYNKTFNFSAINNCAVKEAEGKYILFLNNDTEVVEPGWLSAMLEHIQRKEIGAVGAKLLYFNDTVQHAGVVMGFGGLVDHISRGIPDDKAGYFMQTQVVRNFNVVTAACMLTKKKVFVEIGGFDEKNLPISFNDVDLCLKMRERGHRIVWTPYAKLYHFESLSRGNDDDLQFADPDEFKRVWQERSYIARKWKKYIERDEYYNPNLSLEDPAFELRKGYSHFF